MKKILNIILTLTVLFSLVGCSSTEKGNQQKLQLHEDNYILSLPKENISESEIEALSLAINDEYKARAIYKKVIEKFGEVNPFSNIINAENNHISELKKLYNKYELDIPADEWYDKVPEFDSVAEACLAGVDAEIENAALYDELFSKVDNQDIIMVFTSLRDASENNHLPAFERCSSGR